MVVIKYIGIAIYIVICIAIIILAMLQAKNSTGASEAVMGGADASGSGNFYEKNKGRTKEGKMKRWTIILGIVFTILTIALSIIWEIAK